MYRLNCFNKFLSFRLPSVWEISVFVASNKSPLKFISSWISTFISFNVEMLSALDLRFKR